MKIRYGKDGDPHSTPVDLSNAPKYRRSSDVTAVQQDADFEVVTSDGIKCGNAGDYLVLNDFGELYIIAKVLFEGSYKPVVK